MLKCRRPQMKGERNSVLAGRGFGAFSNNSSLPKTLIRRRRLWGLIPRERSRRLCRYVYSVQTQTATRRPTNECPPRATATVNLRPLHTVCTSLTSTLHSVADQTWFSDRRLKILGQICHFKSYAIFRGLSLFLWRDGR